MVKYVCKTCGREFLQNVHFPCENKQRIKLVFVDLPKFPMPILKWAGGKTQILSTLIDTFPKNMNNYHEIFLGGGSVLLAVLALRQSGEIQIGNKICASDINPKLINVYTHIQKSPDQLYKHLSSLLKEYSSIQENEIIKSPHTEKDAKSSRKSYYYWVRKLFNETTELNTKSAAMFIFLNKTCFRGLYRESSKGFNVPYGHYKTCPNITKETIDTISKLIQGVVFRCLNFKESLKQVCFGDFVYLDPPYAPEKQSSFVGYVKDGFNVDEHIKLFDMIKELGKRAKFVLSNANVPLVRENFKGYNIQDIKVRRAINPKQPESTTTEVIIHNDYSSIMPSKNKRTKKNIYVDDDEALSRAIGESLTKSDYVINDDEALSRAIEESLKEKPKLIPEEDASDYIAYEI